MNRTTKSPDDGPDPDPRVLRDRWLRRLSPAADAALDERLLADDRVADALLEAQIDLIDDRAAGRLSARDAEDVDRYLLSSAAGRRQLAMAQALHRARLMPRRIHRRIVGLGVAAALSAVGVAVWTLGGSYRSGLPPAVTAGAVRPALPTLSLTLVTTRGAPAAVVLLPAVDDRVQLEVEVPDDASELRLELGDARESRTLPLTTPAPLSAGTYRYVATTARVADLRREGARLRLWGRLPGEVERVVGEWRFAQP